jgi:hypothetical protein
MYVEARDQVSLPSSFGVRDWTAGWSKDGHRRMKRTGADATTDRSQVVCRAL